MAAALALAERTRGRTAPNPNVGCIIVDVHGRVAGRGWTQPGGRPHAEAAALAQAGARSRGATAYVTLEPCAHTGQTGPCADALVEAGIARVVIAARDPDDRVNGRGIERLADNGVDIQIGVEAEAARQVMAGFLARVTMSRPLVTLKTATSLDGMIALGDGAKRWITGADMRRYVHLQRSRSDGLLSAIGTVLADDPEFTCRTPGLEADSPHRFILDANLRTPADARILAGGETTVITTENIALGESGKVVVLAPDAEGRIDVSAWVQYLGEQAFNEIMVEAGPTLSGALLKGGWVDRLIIYQAPKLLGDDARAMAAMNFSALTEAPEFEINEVTRIGEDLRIIAAPKD